MRLATTERARVTRHTYNALYVARQDAGLKQSQVAAAAGVTQAAISLLEKGRRKPSAALAERLARLLRTTPKRLFPPDPIAGVLVTPIQLT